MNACNGKKRMTLGSFPLRFIEKNETRGVRRHEKLMDACSAQGIARGA